jgi:hypothetical protein
VIVVELFMVGVVVAVLGGWYRLSRRRRSGGGHDDPGREARLLRRTAFGAVAASSALIGLFVVGETFADPGGWEAVALVSAWAVPLVVVAVLAWRRPDLGLRVLGALVAAMVVVSVWFALDPNGWRSFEDDRGPVRTIATFAIAAPLALLGLRRPGRAGLELVVLAVLPPVVCSLGSRAGLPSLFAVATVPMLAGVLFLLSTWVDRGGPPRYGPAR